MNYTDKIKRERAEEWRTKYAINIDEKLTYLGVPRRYLSADCTQDISDWSVEAKDTWSMLVICGPVGTGKTWSACGLLRELALKGILGRYTTAMNLSKAIIDKTADDLIDARFLVIDEIGRQFNTDQEKNRMFEVVNSRYESMLPLVMVGNFTKSQLKEQLGEAIADRIRENVTFITLDGESRRGK